ncbi:uncharacterized protein BXIN_1693 [Babesia sp. Xinjiang]|uniref:uncharacterized protein n=1 Tax=Babesia sp. Xinjiang TaxID=462227 RepID=UPI000A215F44|nr:uncharacterized protein BXIN_1727 [Babesia sp. Xinjiang]XP_028871415.1 uncharacterized protein BXIN_1693 [Babesia sp. Xinjiang]ORM40866.1 hypothetical protein BXIN_1727 [Babesia sp. Xinjiang]ORM40959.1 hypothetical protein BXIN_1693 [Babesia sp. Xinjiang]
MELLNKFVRGTSGMPITQLSLLLLGILMKVVKAALEEAGEEVGQEIAESLPEPVETISNKVVENVVQKDGGISILGSRFSRMEVAFGILGILILILFIVAVHNFNGSTASWACMALEFILLLPFLYCAYRLHLLDRIIGMFKRTPKHIAAADNIRHNIQD